MICFNNIPGIILIKINTDEMSQNSLCKKDINLLTVFKAQEFAIILLLQLKALKWESFLLIRVHQMSPFQKSKHLLILLTLRQKCMLHYLWWWLVCWKCYKNIRAIYNKLTVNIDSDIFIYTLFTAITSVCMCKIFLIYINYIIVNFRKKLYSCQAITHFFTNYQILVFFIFDIQYGSQVKTRFLQMSVFCKSLVGLLNAENFSYIFYYL